MNHFTNSPPPPPPPPPISLPPPPTSSPPPSPPEPHPSQQITPHHSNHHRISSDRLPTYAELTEREGHRFGRWAAWIEKRARERACERNEERQQAKHHGRSFGTGWDLASSHPDLSTNLHPFSNQSGGDLDRSSSIISSQNEHNAFASAAQNRLPSSFNNPKRTGTQSHASSSQLRPILEPGPGVVNLTPSTSIHQIGSRFLPQFNSQPLCAIPLPLNNPNVSPANGQKIERFLLVGTSDGLYVCDLVPALSQTIKTDSVSSSDAKIFKIWTGLAISQLEIAVEEHLSTSFNIPSCPTSGIIIALTTQLDDSATDGNVDGFTKSIKMWPLQSIINLVKFRTFSENSECLDLTERTTTSKRLSALSVGTQALAGLMSIFEKGKNKMDSVSSDRRSSISASRPPLLANLEGSSTNTQGTQLQTDTDSSVIQDGMHSNSRHPQRGLSTSKSPFVPSSDQFHLELPLQWAKQSVSLDLARIQAHGPILFIKLSQSPSPGYNAFNDALDNVDLDTIPSGLRPRSSSLVDPECNRASKTHHGPLKKWLYLTIVTKQMVFVLESQPGLQRTWHLCSEMSAPFAPKTVDLVCAQFTGQPNNRSSLMSPAPSNRSSSTNRSSTRLNPGYGAESVLVTMKEYAVVIRLSDLSVREIDFQGTMSTHQSTSGAGSLGMGRKVTSGSLNSFPSFDSVQATLMSVPRSVPTGYLSSEPILTGRRVGDGSGSRDDSFRVDSRRTHRTMNDRRWIGCEELLIPVPCQSSVINGLERLDSPKREAYNTVLRSVYLVTRGHMTHTVLSPLGTELGSRKRPPRKPDQSSMGSSHTSSISKPMVLKPIHTFTWRAVPVKIRAHIIPTPPEWMAPAQAVDEPGLLFCCLTAFNASGIEVQEGFISVSSVRSLWDPVTAGLPRDHGSRLPFFTPASQYAERLSRHMAETLMSTQQCVSDNERVKGAVHVDKMPNRRAPKHRQESTDTSSYDYNAKIGFLCDGGSWFSTANSRRPVLDRQVSDCTDASTDNGIDVPSEALSTEQGHFFWKESMGEWKILYVSHGGNFST